MSGPAPDRPRLVALAGNPNVGKTTVFNRLTGLRQKVANYPGVTVERKTGTLSGQNGCRAEIVDVPGLYSLNASSLDEEIAYRALTGAHEGLRAPDLVVVVVDASNLERNLYLASQVFDLGIPTIIALNMIDSATTTGQTVSAEALAAELQVPVIPMAATRGTGVDALKAAILGELPAPPSRGWTLPPETAGVAHAKVDVVGRYAWLGPLVARVVERSERRVSWSDRLDAVLTHRIAGPAIFVLVLVLIFQSVFAGAAPFMDAIESATAAVGGALATWLPAGPVRGLLVDGVVAGVGAVVVFLPQILILFFFLGLLEDTGYMSRAAFIMDRVMRRVGLSGRSVVPLLSSFACAIPGIMAARTIDNPRDRLVTVLVAPLMTCSARLPVYTLLIGAFIPQTVILGVFGAQALTLLALYLLGVFFAVAAAWVLRKLVVRGERGVFMMELPPYRWPRFRDVVWRMLERAKLFLTRAGTIILAISIVLWFLASYPRIEPDPALAADQAAAEQLAGSAIGRLGHLIEPAIAPLGYDWKIGVALISSLAAREVAVSALATIYSVGNADEANESLRERLRSDRNPRTGEAVFTPLVAVSLMVFFVLACQCMSTVAIVKRETNTWRWPAFLFAYMTVLAWVAAFVTYQGGMLLGFG